MEELRPSKTCHTREDEILRHGFIYCLLQLRPVMNSAFAFISMRVSLLIT